MLIADETGFLNNGAHSAGMQRQCSGTAGETENCQVGVFLGYASARVRLMYREPYLPVSWTDDRDRCRDVGIPDDVELATKARLAPVMLAWAIERGCRSPGSSPTRSAGSPSTSALARGRW